MPYPMEPSDSGQPPERAPELERSPVTVSLLVLADSTVDVAVYCEEVYAAAVVNPEDGSIKVTSGDFQSYQEEITTALLALGKVWISIGKLPPK